MRLPGLHWTWRLGMTGHRTTIPKGWRFKDGKLIRSDKHLPVNLRLQKKASKRVRPVRRSAPR
jgi:hypothetical protein